MVAALVEARGEREVVKVKSLTTDEIRLNESLAAVGIDVVETDLAELICQLAGEESSHILVPAIHKNRVEIRDLFRRELGLPNLSEEPTELAEAARLHLRERFLRARVAVSGANFAVAETGTVCVVESEGNGRFCTTLPETLITVLGIEKLVPAPEDLEVYLQLLPRSSTGERMNPYTSLWTGVTPGDGPQEFHVVLLDAGRTDVLADEVGRQTLACIRCSACLNVCPVYERTGGHAYESVYPGPIGAILTPQLRGIGAPPRFRTRRASAVPATRSVRSRSTSPRCWSIFAAGSSPSRRPRAESAPPCVSWRGSSPPSAGTGRRSASRGSRAALRARRPDQAVARPRRVDRDSRPAARCPPDLPRMVGLAVSAAREEILARIRRALADVPAAEGPADVPVARGYLEREPGGALDRFLERVADYGAGVRLASAGDLPAAVGDACRKNDIAASSFPGPARALAARGSRVRSGREPRRPRARRAGRGDHRLRARDRRDGDDRPRRRRTSGSPCADARSRLPSLRGRGGAGRGRRPGGDATSRREPSHRAPARHVRLRPLGDLGHRALPGRGRARAAPSRARSRPRLSGAWSDRAVSYRHPVMDDLAVP